MHQLSRQRRAQLRNNANGMCAIHKDRPLAKGSNHWCGECWQKQARYQKAYRQKHGARSHVLTKAEWDMLDLSAPPKILAASVGVHYSSVIRHRISRGIRVYRKKK